MQITKTIAARILTGIVLGLAMSNPVYGQNLQSKLSQKANFVPDTTSSLEQLIQIAKHYRIPMGIEWVDTSDTESHSLGQRAYTDVESLIGAVLKPFAGYRWGVRDGVLHIGRAAFVADRRNFLSIRIPDFQVKEANLFDAEALLKEKINVTLHPERYAGGYNGGYGTPHLNGFDSPNITFSGHNLTVRQILNKIARANGNTVWVVRLLPSKMMSNEPFFAQGFLLDRGEAPSFTWKFIPFGDIKSATR